MKERFQSILGRIATALKTSGRPPNSITIVAATKNQPLSALNLYRTTAQESGHPVIFGENYVQELAMKAPSFSDSSPKVSFHLIGPLQSNKASKAILHANLIETIHTIDIAHKISSAILRSGHPVMPIYLQVNISQDPGKSGFLSDVLPKAYEQIMTFPGIQIKGLMTITIKNNESRRYFELLRDLRDKILCVPNLSLSMGMSADFEYAICEGATHIRLGAALFSDTQYKN